MSAKNNPLLNSSDNSGVDQLKQRLNNFFINYFGLCAWILGLAIFSVGLFFFVYPKFKKITANQENAQQVLLAEYQKKADYLNKLKSLRKTYQWINEEDEKKIESMLQPESKVIMIVPEIEAIINRNNAELTSIKVEPQERPVQAAEASVKPGAPAGGGAEGIFAGKLPNGVRQAKIEITLEIVSYQTLKNIIKSFENNIRLFDIAKIDYNAPESKAALTLYSYYFSN